MYSDQDAFQSRGCCHAPTTYQKSNDISQHSCCKLDSYDWLSDINFVDQKRFFNIVEVRFKNNRKDFYRVPDNEIFRVGDIVAVESSPGHDIGIVSLSGEIVRLQMKKKDIDLSNPYFKKIYRKARTSDIEKWTQASALEIPTMIGTRKAVMELGLEMKINDVEYQGDKTKAIFYYTAEGRVDFRELIKILAEKYSVRIEMKQIGVRQESSRLGGIGSCGRELCCSSWLTDFKSVSTVTARNQQLSMNPQKLAGQCGKLKCCLNFENDNYKEELRKFPNNKPKLLTNAGAAYFQKMDILGGTMSYTYEDNPSNFISLTIENVKKIIELNAQNKKADSLEEYTEGIIEENIKFDNVIGQDDLTRFDSKDKSKRKNNKNSKRNGAYSKKKQNGANRDNNKQPQKQKPSAKLKNNENRQTEKQNPNSNKSKQLPNKPKAQGKGNNRDNQNRPKRKFRNKQNNKSKPNQDSKS
ncbi:MAG: hypothetical protein DRI86_05970 [Bacteroidetes bacterium]|nr:MAG: hypothetical protein DRI86_05970 [Bacteroidota bacterium]